MAMKPPTEPAASSELLKPEEVAFVLRKTTAAVYAQIERGQMPGLVRIGRSVRVSRDVLRKAYSLAIPARATGSPTSSGG